MGESAPEAIGEGSTEADASCVGEELRVWTGDAEAKSGAVPSSPYVASPMRASCY